MTNQEIASKIVKILDDYMLKNNKSFLPLSAANSLIRESSFYHKNKLDKNILKKLLDSGLIPNASQTKHKPRQWRILPSSALKPKNEIATTNSSNHEINKQTASTQKFFVTIKCPWGPHKIKALVPNSGKTLIRCATCNKVFEYPDPDLIIEDVTSSSASENEAKNSESPSQLKPSSSENHTLVSNNVQETNKIKISSLAWYLIIILISIVLFSLISPFMYSSKKQNNPLAESKSAVERNKTDYDTLTGIEYIEKYRNSNTAKTQVEKKKLFVQAEAYNDGILSCNIGVVSASNSNEFLKLPKSGALDYVFYTADGKKLNLDPYTEIQASSDLIYMSIRIHE